MTKSMTGFGKYSKSTEKYDISIEIKSVNSKYFDINFRLPKSVSALEITLRHPLQDILIRGKIDVRIEINMHTIIKYPSLNTELVNVYREIFTKIAKEADIEDKPKLDHFIRMPDVVDYINDESMEEELEKIGVNNSVIHVDFMIGTSDLEITGINKNGETIQIFSKGNWAF